MRPSRRMLIESAMAAISFSLCEMITQVMPPSRRPRSSSSRWAESSSFSAAVGSSRISSRTSLDSALAISTSCCLPTPMSATGVTGFSGSPTRSSSSRASWLVRFQSIRPRVARSLPRKMFSAIDSWGQSASSWWMMTIPRCSLSLMPEKWHGSPSKEISPSYEPWGYTPDSTFIRVDLPAPFSPQMAWISPRRTDRLTS